MYITSIKDEKIVLCRSLSTTKGRLSTGKFLLYNQEQIAWAMAAEVTIDFIITIDPLLVTFNDIPIYQANEGVLKKATETSYCCPVIAVGSLDRSAQEGKRDFVIVLDNLVDEGNIGSTIRTAHSFGINTFYATQPLFDQYKKKIIDASRGMVFHSIVTTISNQALCKQLKQEGYQIITTSPHASLLQSQVPLDQRPIALVLGNETDGCDSLWMQEADAVIQIPMLTIESLNVAVAAGISMYELKFKQVLGMIKQKILNNFGRSVNVTGMLIQQVFDIFIKKITHLSGKQVIFLMILICDVTMTKEQASQDIGLSGQELDDFLSVLVQDGLIAIHNGIIFLQDKAEIFCAQVWPVVEQAEQAIVGSLAKEEKEILERSLLKIQEACCAIINNQSVLDK